MKKESIVEQLKDSGHKVTKYRVAVLDILRSANRPLAVAEILEQLQKKELSPNKTTVYRELDFLKANNFVTEIQFGDNKNRYELADMDHHHHLICNNCQRVEDVVLENDLDGIEKKIQQSTDFEIRSHSLEFFGLCNKCR